MQPPTDALNFRPTAPALISTDPASIWVASFSRQWRDENFDACIKGLPYLLATSAASATTRQLDLPGAYARLRIWWDDGLEFLALYHRHATISPCPRGTQAADVYVDRFWRPVALLLFRSNVWMETVPPKHPQPQAISDGFMPYKMPSAWHSRLPVKPVVEGLVGDKRTILIEHLWAAESTKTCKEWALQAMATLLHNVPYQCVCVYTPDGGAAGPMLGEFDRTQYEGCFTIPGATPNTRTTTLEVYKTHHLPDRLHLCVGILHPREQLALARHFPKTASWQADLPLV